MDRSQSGRDRTVRFARPDFLNPRYLAFGNKAVYRTAVNFDADPGELLVERDVAFQNNDLIYDSIVIIFNPVIALPSLASTL